MAMATWAGEPDGDEATTVFGKTFPAGVAVDVSDMPAEHVAKLRASAAFEVTDAPAPRARRATISVAEPAADE